MRVFWAFIALNDLQDIFEYHKTIASVKTARKLVKNIVVDTNLLQNNPELGRIEELLVHRENHYRFIVVKNYKVIYWIKDNLIHVATVFDTRQNPEKLNQKLE